MDQQFTVRWTVGLMLWLIAVVQFGPLDVKPNQFIVSCKRPPSFTGIEHQATLNSKLQTRRTLHDI